MKKILFFCFIIAAYQGVSQKRSVVELTNKTRILFIVDCSNSMWEKWQSDSKIKVTQTVLTRLLDSIEKQKEVEIGLRVFGHLNKGEFGTKLEVPFDKDNKERIRSKIKTLVPKGGCTAASALSKSLDDFPHNEYSRNLIIIITDGVDDCDGNVCQVARNIEESGVVVQTYIIGIGNKEEFKENWTCAGEYVHISDEEMFTSTLSHIINFSSNQAKVVVNLLDEFGNATITNVPITFHDERMGLLKNQYLHTFISKPVSDTFLLDPLMNYTMLIHTLPKIEITGVKGGTGKPQVFNVKVNNGTIWVGWKGKKGNIQQNNFQYIIREKGNSTILQVQNMGEPVSIREGVYDLEVLTTPVTYLENVEVKANTETNIGLPYQGKVNFVKPKQMLGSILYEYNGKVEYIGTIDPAKDIESRILMPGNYMIMIRSIHGNSIRDIIKKDFKIESGQSTNVSFTK